MTDFIQSDWNENDSGNTNASPNGVAGSYSPSSVAPIIRAIRGAAKRSFVRSNPLYSTSGTGSSYTLTYIAGPVSYQKGEIFRVWAHADNTGPATININTLGAKQLLSQHGTPLVAGAITAGSVIEFVFDGTSFILLSNEKSKAVVQTSMTINSGSGVSPALALSPNNVIRAALSSSANGGIAVTLSNANSAFVRSLVVPETGSATLGGDIIWTSGNDGAGSTLDADLLDGQHGAFYSDLTNSTGTLPAARLSGDYSFAGLTLSGTLNANTVNVSASDSPTFILTRNGIKTGQIVSDGASTYLRRFNSTTGAAEGYILISGNGVNDFVYNGSTVWHSGNDGAGTGLDADLLDGQQGSFYQNLANSTGTLPNARISGNYDGIGNLGLTGTLSIVNSAPQIVMTDTTSGGLNTRIVVDANRFHLQKAPSGTTSWSSFLQFDLTTTNAYSNGDLILTDGNHAHLAIGTTAATARTAIGINSSLIGSLTAGLTVGALGTYGFFWNETNESVDPGETRAGSTLTYANGNTSGAGTSPGGTWMCMGQNASGAGSPRIAVWLRVA